MKTGFTIRRIVVLLFVLSCLFADLCYAQFAGGMGTVANPYQVATAAQLDSVRGYLNAHFIQTADISLDVAPYNSGFGWSPLGTQTAPFGGSYFGNGFKLTGLYINRITDNYQGLFGYTNEAEITYLILENASVTGANYTGALIGCAFATELTRCCVQGSVTGANQTGGLLGSLENGGNLTESFVEGTVSGQINVGGITGYNKGNSIISKSVSYATVTGTQATGGLIGNLGSATALNCYATGSVNGNWATGGLAGLNDAQSLISNCFSIGSVIGTTYTGGLVGRRVLGQTTNSYWNTESSGQTSSAGGEGRNTVEMTYPYAPNAYVGWGFGTIWQEDTNYIPNSGYPYLTWEYTPPQVIDLAVSAFSCPQYGNLGLPLPISFSITNNGTNVASSYQIYLKDSLGNLLLSETGDSLNSGASRQVSLSWIPIAEGQFSLFVQVQLLGDQVPGNDSSNIVNVTIFSQDHIIHYIEGSELVRVPMDFYWKNSLYETIFTSAELGFVGNIHQLDFYNHFISNLLNKPTRIWLGESSAGDLSAGWIPSTQLQLVFDGTVDYPGGSNTIHIVLQNPYNYQGANLVMLVQRPMDTAWFSTQDFFYGASTGAYNALQLISDTTAFDPSFPPSSGTLYPQQRPALTFHVAGSLQMLPPTDFSLNYTSGNDFVELSWAAPIGSSPSEYLIYRNGLLLASVSDATSFIDTGLTHGIAYYYQVAADYPAGTSNLTDSLAVTIYKKPLPADLVYPAQSASIESILPEFSWQASEGGGTFPQPDGYIFKLMDLSENQLLEEDVGNETSYQCPFSLNWNSGYLWQIFPYLVLPGSTQLINTDSPTWSFYTQEIMGQPVNLQATVLDWQDVQLTWTMDRSGEPDAGKDSSLSSALSAGQRELQQFNIYRNGLYLDNCNETSYSDAGLADGYYEYYVIAIYESGESAPSDTAEVNINTVYPVQDLQADILGDVVQISWNPSLPGFEESYQIFRLGYGSEDYPELWTLLATGIQNHLYQDTEWGILPDGSYRWAVAAEYTGGTMAETIFSNPLQKNNPFPIISVNPGLIEYSISDTDTLHLQLTIANSGSADLIWDSQLVYERTGQNRNLNIYLDPSSGMIEPGSQQVCSLVIAPIYSVLGMNNYELCINSNDPVSSTTIIPINITVNSTPANIPDANFRIAINDALGQGEEYQPTIADLNGMSGMLEAYDRGITSIEGAQYLTNMDGLKLDTNQISDLTELGSLNNLSYLSLTNNQITDISPLANLHNLTTLQFSINQVADISPLTQLTALNTLYIGQNQISELSPLSGLVNLQSLDLSFNVINDISAISNLGNLTSFSAVNNQISNVSPLALLLNLQHVQLNLNQISDISALSGLVNLLSLDLNYNPVSDIAPLTNLVNLQNLYLKSSQVSDLSPLSGLHSLGTLYLGFSQINNINSLSSLASLAYLDLEYNQISDLSALANLINLELLTLEGNPLSKESMLLTQSWSLPYVATTYNPISPCYPFPARDQTDISLSSVLSWSGNYNGDTSSFEVWAGFTPSALELNGSVAATADTLYGYSLPLTAYTNYYWRIKAIGSTETIWSGMWHFSTVGDVSGNVDRNLVVVEIGEGTWCQYCVGSAIGAQELLANDHPVAIINNHISDSFTNTYSNARNSYYNISGYPTAFFDGLNSSVGGSASVSMYSTYLPRVNSRIAIQSSYGISASGTFVDNILSLSALVAKPGPGTYNNVVLHCVITESNLDYNWFSQTQVHSVNRLMVPDQNGTPISLNTGQWTTIPLNIVIDNAWDLSNCEVVLFLQNTTTKEIIQGAKYPLTEFIEIPNPPSNVLAVDNGTSVNVSWNSPSGTTPQNYAVYRLLSGQETEETAWALLASSNADTSYEDTAWNEVSPGTYRWAVKAIYGSEFSLPAFSNVVEKLIPTEAIIAVTPESINHSLPANNSAQLELSIANSGSALLEWTSSLNTRAGTTGNQYPAPRVTVDMRPEGYKSEGNRGGDLPIPTAFAERYQSSFAARGNQEIATPILPMPTMPTMEDAINPSRNLSLNLDPANGSVDPYSNLVCYLNVDSSGSLSGTYEYELVITSNAVNQTQVTIPITITVTGTPAYIPDDNFRMAINDNLGQPQEYQPTIEDLNGIYGYMDVGGRSITNMEGAQYLINLQELGLGSNQISDLSPLSGLTNLQVLILYGNQISDLSPLSALTNLQWLYLSFNQISELSPLNAFTNLQYLDLGHNQISDLSPLSALTNLPSLGLDDNQISDLSPLNALTNLLSLVLDGNQISDLSPLSGLTNLYYLYLNNNPLSYESMLLSQSWSLPWSTSSYNPLSPCYPNPERNALDIPVNTDLIWEANYDSQTASYEVYLGTNRSELVYQGMGIAGSNFQYSYLPSLQPNTEYWWRIKAISGTEEIWSGLWSFTTGEEIQEFAGGSGTEADPYQVATPVHLNNVRNHLGAYFQQIADIDLGTAPWNEGEGWEPIGNAGGSFTGYYDSGTHTISGLYINRPSQNYQGLFGRTLDATIYNVKLISASVNAGNWAGALIGYADSTYVAVCSSSGSINGQGGSIGGLIGRMDYSELQFSYSSAEVYGGGWSIGGLVGRTDYSQVVDCYSTGNVSGNGILGGLIGYILANSLVQNSFCTGSVSGNDDYIGGFAGDVFNSVVENSYSRGSVSAAGFTYVGGFTGETDNSTLTNCYSTGYIIGGSESCGGFVGANTNASTFISCYWDIETSNQVDSAGGEGRSTSAMTYPYAANTYVGWDWDFTWAGDVDANVNGGYSYLQWFAPAPQYYPPRFAVATLVALDLNLVWQSPLTGTPDSYQVWRLQPGQESDEASWVLVAGSVADTMVTDTQWQYLEDGEYIWAVKAIYMGGSYSAASLSNMLMKTTLFPAISVNPPSISATLNVMATTAQELTISNSGSGDLNWNSQIDVDRGVSFIHNSTGNSRTNLQREAIIASDPSSGTVLPGANQLVNLSINAGDTAPGTYNYNYTVFSNDPIAEAVVIPISLEITETHNVPESLTANAGDSVIFLSWNGINSPSLLHYQIYRDGLPLSTTTNNYYEDSTVVNATSYSYYLTAVYMYGVSPMSNVATAIPQSAMDTGLVRYYPLNGNGLDVSGNGNHLQVYGATGAFDRFGNASGAYYFNGSSNYLKGSANGLPSAQRSIAAWIHSTDLSSRPVIMGFGGAGSGTSWLEGINMYGNPAISLATHSGSHALAHYYEASPVGQWLHLAITTGSEGTKMFINGTLVESNASFVNNTVVSAKDLAIGVAVSSSGTAPYADGNMGYFKGMIDDIRIYNRVLSQAEILNLYNYQGNENIPSVTTAAVINIAQTSATSGGNVTSDGGYTVGSRGLVWSTSRYPTLTNNQGISYHGTGTGSFVTQLSGLNTSTTYYLRAFATNSYGTAYGEERYFTTLASEFSGGAGIVGNPYLVATAEHLYNVRNYPTAHFKQTAEINLSVAPWNLDEGWQPIGNSSTRFQGTYDGDGHTISGLYINRTSGSYQGLFGYCYYSTIKNLSLNNVYIAGYSYTGGLVGSAQTVTVDNCHSSGNVIGSSESYNTGGLIGSFSGGSISNSSSSSVVNGYSSTGGLVGYTVYTNLSNCYSTGSVSGTSDNTGGLAGRASYSSISNCYSSSAVTGSYYYVGGLIGRFDASSGNPATLSGSYSTGSVTGYWGVGGLLGSAEYSCTISNSYSSSPVSGTDFVGGLVGYITESSSITNSYSRGSVSGSSELGGLVGYNSTSTVTRSYWDTQSSGQSSSAGGGGRTTAQMTYPYDANTYLDWDFLNIWATDTDYSQNYGYPYLQWQDNDPEIAPEYISVQVSLSVNNVSNEAILRWDRVREAISYQVYYTDNPFAVFPNGWSGPISIVDNQFIDMLAECRFYKVMAEVNRNGARHGNERRAVPPPQLQSTQPDTKRR